MNTGKVFLGIVAAAAVGAALGVLYAPAKGSTIRKRLAKKGTEYADDANEKLNEYSDAVTEGYDTLVEGGADLVKKAKEKAACLAETKHAR